MREDGRSLITFVSTATAGVREKKKQKINVCTYTSQLTFRYVNVSRLKLIFMDWSVAQGTSKSCSARNFVLEKFSPMSTTMQFSCGTRWSKSMVQVRLGKTMPSPNFFTQKLTSSQGKTGLMACGVRFLWVAAMKSK
jgi:hypothetical protein